MRLNDVEASRRSGPIFIVGAMGSGTTLLRLILDSHENIAIAQETGFMRAVLANKWIPFWKFGGEWYGRLGVTEEELDQHLRELYGALFASFAQRQGKTRWGDKTPYHTWHLREAARVFPDAVFVAAVRHPGAVASSLHERFKYDWPKSVGHWMRSNMELLHRAGELGDRFALCRYEDLVLQPELTVRELLEWLGEPWSPRVLQHHVVHSERGTPARVEGRTRSDVPIDASRIARWTDSMDADGYRELRERAGALAAFFGYSIDEPTATEPLLANGGPRQKVLDGDDVERRKVTAGEHVDWSYRPRASMANQLLKPQKFELVAVRSKKVKKVTNSPAAAAGVDQRATKAVARGAARAVRRLPEPAQAAVRRLLGRRTALPSNH